LDWAQLFLVSASSTALELAELSHLTHQRAWLTRLVNIAPILVLVGGFVLRPVIVCAGQAAKLT
jgi:formate-dependent nitrite reductase membrane component NrfD